MAGQFALTCNVMKIARHCPACGARGVSLMRTYAAHITALSAAPAECESCGRPVRPTKLPALVYFIFMDPYGILITSVFVASLADEAWALAVVLCWVSGLLSIPLHCPLEVTRESPPHPLWRAITTAVGWATLIFVVFVIALMLLLP